MNDVKVTLIPGAVRRLLQSPEVAAHVGAVADRIAATATDLAGAHSVTTSIDGARVTEAVPVDMRRTSWSTGDPLDDQTPVRARSAVLVSHPTPSGREAGMRALLAALDSARTL